MAFVVTVALLTSSLLLGPTALASTYAPPLPDPTVVRTFDPPTSRWGAGHRGVDLAAHPGDLALAPADGIVAFAGTVVNRGVVVINHPDGLRSTLEPVTPSVEVGQSVRRGEVVGTVQDAGSHCEPDTCAHWGVRRGDVYLDPWLLIDATPRPIRLLPLCGHQPTITC